MSSAPYGIGSSASKPATTTATLTAGSVAAGGTGTGAGTTAGDAIIVGVSITSLAITISGVTDTRGNVYIAVSHTAITEYDACLFIASYGSGGPGTPTAALVSGTDVITATLSSSNGGTNAVNMAAIGCTGIVSTGAIDVNPTPTFSAASASPSITSGTLAQASELIVCWCDCASGGGAIAWGSPFASAGILGSVKDLSNQESGIAAAVVSATTSAAYGGTITSAKWVLQLVSLKISLPVITTSSLPGGTAGTPYNQTLAETGGVGAGTWSVSAGSLSPLSLSSAGVITGTPTASGTLSFTAEVTDSNGNTATQPLTITVTGGSATRNLLIPPAGYCLFGAYPGGGNAQPAAYQAADMADRTLAVVSRYYALDQVWPTANDQALQAAGQAICVDWAPRLMAGGYATWASVTAGTYDAQIEETANALAAFGSPIFVGLTNEFDGNTYLNTENGGLSASYVPYYQHIHGIVAPIAPNVIWLWVVTSSNDDATTASMFPGASYVDWLGADPYDETLSKGSPDAAYTSWVNWVTSQSFYSGQPLAIIETGVDNDVADASEATWLGKVPASMASLGISMWLWFNSSGTLGNCAITPGSLSATELAAIGASAVFSPPSVLPAGAPYLAGGATSQAASTTLVIPVSETTTAGDAITVFASVTSLGETVTSVTDSAGNTYAKEVTQAGSYDGAGFVALNTAQLVAGTGTITVTYSSASANAKNAAAVGCSGVLTTGAVDAKPAPSSSAGSTSPAISTGALAQASELIVAWCDCGSGGGNIAWSGLTPLATGIESASNQISSIAAGTVASAASVTAGGTLPSSAKWAMMALSLKISTTPVISTSSLPGGNTGVPYTQALSVTGGLSPYTWSLSAGSLPSGMTLGASTGVISGTATAAGTSSFTAKVTDSASNTATKALSIVVASNVDITTTTLPGGAQAEAYSQALAVAGGTAPYTWAVSAGSLPAGLTLGASTGVISGTPAAAGTSSFTVQVTDSASNSDTQALSVVIGTDLAVTTTGLPGTPAGTAYSQSLAASGGTPAYTWSLASGTLPVSLTLSSAGLISGTPSVAGTYSFTVQVTDTAPSTATQALRIVITVPVPGGGSPVVNQWAGTVTQPSVFGPVPAGIASAVVPLNASASVGGGTGTPTAGNWLFALIGWNASASTVPGLVPPVTPPVTVSVGDDTHQWWRPAPPSPAAGASRTAVWYQPNIMPPAAVYVAPSGFASGFSVLVIEVQGLSPWDAVTGTDAGYGLDVTSLGLSLAAPGAEAFIIAAVTGDNSTDGLVFAPAGWTPLQHVLAANATDHTSDAVLTAACITSSAAQSVTASSAGGQDLSGFMIAVETAAPSPVPGGVNPNWPYVIFEAAFGSGYQTPPDQMTWTNLQSAGNGRRLRSWSEETGVQYELDALEASEVELLLDNPDGNLSPWNGASPWYPDVVPGTPVRIRAVPPATTGTDRWYVWQRNMERWPQGWDKAFRGESNATATDVWSVINRTLPTCYRAEVLNDGPYAWWPGDDSGENNATTLVNAAPGNNNPLVITAAPGGASTVISSYPFPGAVNTYSAIPSFAGSQGWMYGDPDSAAFAITGCGSPTHGYYLACTDPDFPSLAGSGITIEGWWNAGFWDPDGQAATLQDLYGQPDANLVLWQIQDSSGNPVASLWLAQGTGELTFVTWEAGGTGENQYAITSADNRDTSWLGVTVTLNATTQAWDLTLNGGVTTEAGTLSLTPLPSSFESFYMLGTPVGGSVLGCCSAQFSHAAIYPYVLPQQRITAHFVAAYTAFGQLPAPVIEAQFIANAGAGSPQAYSPDGSLRGGQAFSQPGGGGAPSLGAVACAVCGGYTSAPSGPPTILNVLPTDDGPGFCWVDAGSGDSSSGSFAAPSYEWFTGSGHGTELEDAVLAPTHPYVYVSSYGGGAPPPAQASALGDSVQGRIERLLQAGLATGPRCIDPSAEPVLAALDTGGLICGNAIGNIVTSDNGLLFTDNMGALCYWQRSHLAAQVTAWILGPNIASGQIPFMPGGDTFDTDPQRVLNDIALTQYDITQAGASAQSGLSTGSGEASGGLVYSPAASLYPQVQASLLQNGDCQYAVTTYLQSTADIQAGANWLFTEYGSPVQRITALTVSAAAMTRTCPQAWLFVLGANVGDLIQAVARYPGQPPVTGTWRITKISGRKLDWAGGSAEVTIACDYAPRTFWGVTTLPVMQDEANATITDEQGGWLS